MDWFKSAVIYEALLPNFKDSDADGVGDIVGLTGKLDYLADLGITCVWLGPFFDSPRQDDGYDVRDYYAVDSRFGTQSHFERLMSRADDLGLRVIIDVPLNHTSVEHHWFQSAREDEGSPYRDFYQWADEQDDEKSVVGGSAWTYDEVAKKYYYHAFFPFQPDLDLANPRVRLELFKVLEYWLEQGVSGFRLDAVPLLLDELDGTGVDLLAEIRDVVQGKNPDAVLLAEGDVGPIEIRRYFEDGGRVPVVLNFYLNAHVGHALATGDAAPLRKALTELPHPPDGCSYANFLRSHDEWSFRQVTEELRDEVFARFETGDSTRMFGTGIRRRLAPLLDGDEDRLRLAFSLLFTMPGTPIVYYGDEIGMGDDLSLKGRAAVRTPMQWSPARNAGFSEAPSLELAVAAISDGPFAYPQVNVEAQLADSGSLLNWMKRALDARARLPTFGRASHVEALDLGDDRVLCHVARHGPEAALALHNVSSDEVFVELPGRVRGDAVEVFPDPSSPVPGDGRLSLGPRGFRWLSTSRT